MFSVIDIIIQKVVPNVFNVLRIKNFHFKKFILICRFDGIAPEPREGIKSGHMPGSKCVPFTEVKKLLPNLLMRCLTCFNVPALNDLLFIRQNSVTACLGGQDEFKCVDLPHINVFSH